MSRSAEEIKLDFPCLLQQSHGKELVFLDSAASAQKPRAVLDSLHEMYTRYYANVHRGVYELSQNATERFEAARVKVASFLNAPSDQNIVFTRGATESINLVAHSYGLTHFSSGDEIIISQMEHHANLVPWQYIAKQTGAVLRYIPVTQAGELDMAAYESMLSERTAFVSIVHLSNSLGTLNPVEEIIQKAHAVGAKVLVDASQSVVHQVLDVQAMGCDFLVFSGHKLYGPNGTGVLYGRYDLLESMPPLMYGGEMITSVTYEQSHYQLPPLRFEAGTPVIAEVVALGAAIDYLGALDRDSIAQHEKALLAHAEDEMRALGGFTIIGNATRKAGAISFVHETAHPNDIGAILDRSGVAIRTGDHCCEPLMRHLNVPGTARISFACYTTHQDVERFISALKTVQRFF